MLLGEVASHIRVFVTLSAVLGSGGRCSLSASDSIIRKRNFVKYPAFTSLDTLLLSAVVIWWGHDFDKADEKQVVAMPLLTNF